MMNTKTMRKAARDLVPGDVLCAGVGRGRVVVVCARVLSQSTRIGTQIELTLGTLGEFGASNSIQDHAADSQFMVELPAGLTPVQAAADKLLGHALHLRELLNTYPALLSEREEFELAALLDELDPPKPPTLEEAIAALDLLTKAAGTKCEPEALEVSRKLLARVPEA